MRWTTFKFSWLSVHESKRRWQGSHANDNIGTFPLGKLERSGVIFTQWPLEVLQQKEKSHLMGPNSFWLADKSVCDIRQDCSVGSHKTFSGHLHNMIGMKRTQLKVHNVNQVFCCVNDLLDRQLQSGFRVSLLFLCVHQWTRLNCGVASGSKPTAKQR